MSSLKEEKLLFNLLLAQSEEEIKKIIDSDAVLSNGNNWRPYGGYETNFNTIDNQQKSPVAALIEKPINSIDALLLKECKLRGVDPKGMEAPRDMVEAVERFFDIKKGDFSEVGREKRREIANNIRIILEGSERKPVEPNIIVIDKGEGQCPSDFKNTFLSLHGKNKIEIPFVQGRYNMGSTGALPNCGKYHYQLILSRKTPQLLNQNQKDLWGFTLVRLHPAGVRNGAIDIAPWYEYCVDENGDIFSFPGRPLKILPLAGDIGKDSEILESGTYIKMYNYDLPEGVRSQAQRDLWRAINKLLYYPALPMLIQDLRYPKLHGYTTVLLGNRMRIFVDNNEMVEDKIKFPVSIEADFGAFGKRLIEITVFKEKIAKNEFTSEDQAIFFAINGQSHATIGRSFLKSKTKANLYYLGDYMLVHIDCTDVSNNVKSQVFMPSRDRMRENTLTKFIEETLAEELSKHEGLKQLNQYRREQKVAENPKDEKFIENIITKLVKNNTSLLKFLPFVGNISSTKSGKRDMSNKKRAQKERQKKRKEELVEIQPYIGKDFPTFLEILKHNPEKGVCGKDVPINSYILMKFKTDVKNDYLTREMDGGTFEVEPDLMKSRHLWNGIITAKLFPPKDVKIGKLEKVQARLTRKFDTPLEVEFEIKYIKPVKTINKKPGRTQTQTQSFNFPKPTLVYKKPTEGGKTWEELDPDKWDENYISEIAPVGDNNLDIFINMDADVLHDFLRRQQPSQKKIEEIKRTYLTSIYLHSLMLYNELKEIPDSESILPQAMKAIAKITLDLIWNEELIKSTEEIE